MKSADFGYEMTCVETMGTDYSSMSLQVGSRGEEVKVLQSRLLANGFDPKGIDGIFGPNTASALNAYKASVGLPENGIADASVFSKLGISSDVIASASNASSTALRNVSSIASLKSKFDVKKVAMYGVPVLALGLIGFIVMKKRA
jgi:peptidoglycan hydrolase-like protein with peptidoglycan-binding domain